MATSAATPSRDRAGRGYGKYIGRVGGLAFALGVGAAVFTGAAVASADTADTSSATSASANSSASSASSPSSSDSQTPKKRRPARVKSEPDAPTRTATGDDKAVDATSDKPVAAAAEETQPATRARRTLRTAVAERTESVRARTDARKSVDAAIEAEAAPSGSFFRNVTPTLAHDPAENQTVDGTIVGDLHPVDPDSTKLTYRATRPTHGTVTINSDGTFVYTPDETYEGQDRFRVTVSDARSDFHFHGAGGILSLLTFGLLGGSGHRTTETVLIGFDREVVASGFNQPVDFRFLPDGRIIVAEKNGAIKIVDDGTVLADPVITLPVSTAFERGIQGIALDPDYSSNGYLYVAYTTTDTYDRLSRVTVVDDIAAPATELVLFQTPGTVSTSHRGGGLAFGPDGKLYWAKGDDLNSANSQDLTTIHGKVLRINPDGSVPSDNPDLTSINPNAIPLIWAYGFRNPFRMSFTPGPDGQLLVADVGQSGFEELNLVTKGGNYGWPLSEGLCTTNCAGQTDPIYTYPRGSGAAITAGVFYTGDQLGSGYQNKVFIADEVQGWIKVLTCSADLSSCGDPKTFDSDAGTTVMLAQGPDDNLYQLVYTEGTLVRIGPAGGTPI